MPYDARLNTVLEYWNEARKDKLVPNRADLTLRGLRPIVSSIAIFELTEHDVLIRLAGTAIRGYWGFEPTGRSLSEFSPPDYWPTRFRRIVTMVNHPCGWWFHLPFQVINGINKYAGVVGLPIRNVGAGMSDGVITVAFDLPFEGETTPNPGGSTILGTVNVITPFSIGVGVPDLLI